MKIVLSLVGTLPLVLCAGAPVLAETIPYTLLASGSDGPRAASSERITSQAVLDRHGPFKLDPQRTILSIGLGEMPSGTRVTVRDVVSKDTRFDLRLVVRLRVVLPLQSSGVSRPHLLVSVGRTPMTLEYSVRARVQLGERQLSSMDLDDAQKTRQRLLRMTRRQRRRVEELHTHNVELRRRVRELEGEILTLSEGEAYRAAVDALPFRAALEWASDLAVLKTDLQIFGTSVNPMTFRGDSKIKYLSELNRDRWIQVLEEAYEAEARSIQQTIAKHEASLEAMRALVAPYESKSKGSLVDGVRGG